MPSFPDLDVPGLDASVEVPTGPAAPADVLARVKADGLRRRTRRHRRNAVLAAFGLAIVAVPAVAMLPGDDGDEDVTVAAEGDPSTDREADERPVTTAAPPVTTVGSLPATTIVVAPTEGPATTVVQGPVTTVPPRTTPVPGPTCRNSTDPACGEFRWDPAPGPNEPLTAAFVDIPASATAGEPVDFFVAWSDPDATLDYDSFSVDGVGLGQPCQIEPRHGPWTPPDPVGGDGELAYTHTFEAPGTYEVTVVLATGPCDSPYNSQQVVRVTITVV